MSGGPIDFDELYLQYHPDPSMEDDDDDDDDDDDVYDDEGRGGLVRVGTDAAADYSSNHADLLHNYHDAIAAAAAASSNYDSSHNPYATPVVVPIAHGSPFHHSHNNNYNHNIHNIHNNSNSPSMNNNNNNNNSPSMTNNNVNNEYEYGDMLLGDMGQLQTSNHEMYMIEDGEEDEDDDDDDGDDDDYDAVYNTAANKYGYEADTPPPEPTTAAAVGRSDLEPLYEISEEAAVDEDRLTPPPEGNPFRRTSTQSIVSYASSSMSSLMDRSGSFSLAPDGTSGTGGGDRRISFSGTGTDNDNSGLNRSGHSKRRQPIYQRASLTGPSDESTTNSENSRTGSVRQSNRLARPTVFAPRRSTRRNTRGSGRRSASSSGVNGDDATLVDAIDRLAGSTNPWDNVAAAAAVVAASTQAPAKRSHIQFGQGDHVLVDLRLLNYMNHTDDKDCFTVDPVNKYGYASGEGLNELQRHGPYKFLLCTVQTVHFDEDERYYTIKRMDTLSEQRAEPAWMEPIKDPASIENALKAAQRTTRSMAEKVAPKAEKSGHLFWLATSPLRFFKMQLVPLYQQTRVQTKQVVERLLHGDGDFACVIRCTGINFLVLCSLVYLFIDVVTLAFLPADLDNAMAILSGVIWLILVLELLFEFLIRPKNYHHLIHTEKSYAPATARHVNKFHLFFEAFALLLFVPSIICVMTDDCGDWRWFNQIEAAIRAVKGDNTWTAALGRLSNGMTFLRCFGLVRHWKQMWISHTFDSNNKSEGLFIRKLLLIEHDTGKNIKRLLIRKKTDKPEHDDTESTDDFSDLTDEVKQSNRDDQQLKNAATIGTGLMLINSHRGLLILLVISTIFPAINTLFGQNPLGPRSIDLLQANNLAANTMDDCDFLQDAVISWLSAVTNVSTNFFLNNNNNETYLLWAQLLPMRCDWQKGTEGIITNCPANANGSHICNLWKDVYHTTYSNVSREYFASQLNYRVSELIDLDKTDTAPAWFHENVTNKTFYVRAIFNESDTVAFTNLSLFLLILSLLMLSLIGLTVMRGDAGRLVLGPLQRMLKIVVRYAENPLSQSASAKSGNDSEAIAKEQLGNYETEQLINAIAKIADLLRKCWGVAGAGIISSNLARTKDGTTVVFNPTVPGKSVYALFGFVAINDFSKQLRVLKGDVMMLINDVARVVHDEVYRWALGDSGQCNKNLGSAFLMVFRIGDFLEVHEKQRKAADVVFKRQPQKKAAKARRKNATKRPTNNGQSEGKTLQLSSLPGIQSFADRALLGMLKSFAGIHRDKHLKKWQNDFRLGAGVGAFKVNVIYGMDAGWAVEGAVGSEYKIDATYLSPHVNMASRMMSACKQYGVTILLSQAVEELLTKTARTKLRHLDTVYVKGSSVDQRIYTYDARFDGVDFFLFERSPEQADDEAAAYTPAIWDTDQDLRSMRQHVTDEFMERFHEGVRKYLEGHWKEATSILQDADDLMLRAVLEEGYVDYKADDLGGQLFDRDATGDEITRIRNEFGDGACKCLIQYMLRRNCVPPENFHGVRALMSK